MAFVYNNKLPFFAWGVSNAEALAYQFRSDVGGYKVPLPSSGAQQLLAATYSTASTTLSSLNAKFEGTPCDAQIPWVMAVVSVGQTLLLTIHGEAYLLEGFDSRWIKLGTTFGSTTRRMSKVCPTTTSEPITWIADLQATNYWIESGSSYVIPLAACVTRDGKAWWITSTSRGSGASRTDTIDLREESIPSQVSASRFWWAESISSGQPNLVLTTTSDKTYLRNYSGSTWYALTGGVYKRATHTNEDFNWWLSNNLPTLTVDNPPSGGTTATVQGVWEQDTTLNGYSRLRGVNITNPGSGYTTNPSVTFSRLADTKSAGAGDTELTLKVFTEHLKQQVDTRISNGSLFLSNTGKVWAIGVPPAPASYLELDWATDRTPKDANQNPLAVVKVEYVDDSSVPIKSLFLANNGNIYSTKIDYDGTFDDTSLFNSGSWVSFACVGFLDTQQSAPVSKQIVCAIKSDWTMWTWGKNSSQTLYSGKNGYYVLFGDDSEIGTTRESPVQIASDAEWLTVVSQGPVFIALQKDAVSRSADQPFEYWPDWAYG